MHSTLISAAQLHAYQHSAAPCVVVDCRFDLMQPAAGRTAYLGGHLPNAVYAHLDEDLSGRKTAATGRHPLPDPAQSAAKFGAWGIGRGTQVVAYDADNGAFAARLWWLLRWLGHDAVAVLDGGFSAWVRAGLPLSREMPQPVRAEFTPHLRADVVVDAEQVARCARHHEWRVLDARAPERYAGAVEPIDAVAGHVPGAHNHPFTCNVNGEGRFLPAEELRARFAQALGAVNGDHVIAMCGSGVTACHNLLALETAGLSAARLYAGSWSEWIRDPSRPVAIGPQP